MNVDNPQVAFEHSASHGLDDAHPRRCWFHAADLDEHPSLSAQAVHVDMITFRGDWHIQEDGPIEVSTSLGPVRVHSGAQYLMQLQQTWY